LFGGSPNVSVVGGFASFREFFFFSNSIQFEIIFQKISQKQKVLSIIICVIAWSIIGASAAQQLLRPWQLSLSLAFLFGTT